MKVVGWKNEYNNLPSRMIKWPWECFKIEQNILLELNVFRTCLEVLIVCGTNRGKVSWSWVEEEDAYWCTMATCLLDVEFSGWWYCHGCLDGCYKLFWAETVSQCRGHVSFLPSGSSWHCSGVVIACIAAVWGKQKCTGKYLNMTKSECERVCAIAEVETVLSTKYYREWMGKYIYRTGSIDTV